MTHSPLTKPNPSSNSELPGLKAMQSHLEAQVERTATEKVMLDARLKALREELSWTRVRIGQLEHGLGTP